MLSIWHAIVTVFRKRREFQATANATLRKKFPRLFVIVVVASWTIVPLAILFVLLRRKRKRQKKQIKIEIDPAQLTLPANTESSNS